MRHVGRHCGMLWWLPKQNLRGISVTPCVESLSYLLHQCSSYLDLRYEIPDSPCHSLCIWSSSSLVYFSTHTSLLLCHKVVRLNYLNNFDVKYNSFCYGVCWVVGIRSLCVCICVCLARRREACEKMFQRGVTLKIKDWNGPLDIETISYSERGKYVNLTSNFSFTFHSLFFLEEGRGGEGRGGEGLGEIEF